MFDTTSQAISAVHSLTLCMLLTFRASGLGEIPPGDVAVFNWLFQPLEVKQYSVALPLGLGPAAPVPLLLRGRSYHPRQAPEQAAPTPEEAAQ
jgi:hypothetical protein